MKTNNKKFSLTTFIKNVQSTIKKVGTFVLNNIEYIWIALGITVKAIESCHADFKMPLSFYTDMALNMLLMWKWLKSLPSNDRILRRRPTICALNSSPKNLQ